MKKSELIKLVGTMAKIRPRVRRVLPRGDDLPFIDDDWRIEAPSSPKSILRLSNMATGHFKELDKDNIYEFRKPNFLVLKCQLTLRGREMLVEPVPDPRTRYSRARPRSCRH